MISTHVTARVTVRVTVEALTVPDHVKFHVRHRRQGAPESVVEESQLTLRGEGTVTVTRNGKTTIVPIIGPPTSRQIVSGDEVAHGQLEVQLSKGLQAFSFTYG